MQPVKYFCTYDYDRMFGVGDVSMVELVQKTNKQFSIARDEARRAVCVVCSKKPENSPTRGIIWHEESLPVRR